MVIWFGRLRVCRTPNCLAQPSVLGDHHHRTRLSNHIRGHVKLLSAVTKDYVVSTHVDISVDLHRSVEKRRQFGALRVNTSAAVAVAAAPKGEPAAIVVCSHGSVSFTDSGGY